MKGINVNRWILGGIAAGVVMWIVEGLASMLYMKDMQAAMEAHNLSVEMDAGMWILSIVVSLILGLALVFFYAAFRPRFGAGAKTALIVVVAFWIGSYLLSLIGYHMMGLFPIKLLVMWGIVAFIEMAAATLLGGWIYREKV